MYIITVTHGVDDSKESVKVCVHKTVSFVFWGGGFVVFFSFQTMPAASRAEQ